MNADIRLKILNYLCLSVLICGSNLDAEELAMASVKLPDGSVRELPDGSSVMQLAESIGKGLARAAVAGKVDGKVVDLSYKLSGSPSVSILTDRDPEALLVLR